MVHALRHSIRWQHPQVLVYECASTGAQLAYQVKKIAHVHLVCLVLIFSSDGLQPMQPKPSCAFGPGHAVPRPSSLTRPIFKCSGTSLCQSLLWSNRRPLQADSHQAVLLAPAWACNSSLVMPQCAFSLLAFPAGGFGARTGVRALGCLHASFTKPKGDAQECVRCLRFQVVSHA